MELLEYVPGVTIDANNNITMEGKDQVRFYVDNKPIAHTGMDANSYLNNLPSFMIERIEVLKVPPDAVDAEQTLVEGRTNIRYINIITRKVQFRGYSAAVTAGVDSRRNLNAKMRFNMNMAPSRSPTSTTGNTTQTPATSNGPTSRKRPAATALTSRKRTSGPLIASTTTSTPATKGNLQTKNTSAAR